MKKKKELIRQLVKECISRELISVEQRRKFARRARRYIVAYRAFALHTESGEKSLGDPTMSASLIKKVVKISKMHRSIKDQEAGYIKGVLDLMVNFIYS